MRRTREIRQSAGAIHLAFSEDLLRHGDKADGRSEDGRRDWKTTTLLKMIMLGLAAGAKGLREVEELSADMPRASKHAFRIPGRVPDTTMRDFIVGCSAPELLRLNHIVGQNAVRRKSLRACTDLPFHVLSMDGKYPSFSRFEEDGPLLQLHHDEEGTPTHGLLRTTTSTLITAAGRPILGCSPIPKETNEMGHFPAAFDEMKNVYGGLFDVVMYDAGVSAKQNAEHVREGGKHFVFQIADARQQIHGMMKLLLDRKPVAFRGEEKPKGNRQLVREIRICSVPEAQTNVTMWQCVKTIVSVTNTMYEGDQQTWSDTRYFASSLLENSLSSEQWLKLIVLRWGVETSHQILDQAFEEDKRPWIRSDANGALVIQILRRLVYTILTLYRSVTLKNDDNREMPYKRLFRRIRDMLMWPNATEFVDLRERIYAVPKALE
jgi:hypothetical protein